MCKQILFGCAKKVPTRAGEGTRPYVAWKKSPPFRKEREKDGAHAGPQRLKPVSLSA